MIIAVSSARSSSSRSRGGAAPKNSSNASAAWPISMSRPSTVSSSRAARRREQAGLERRVDDVVDHRVLGQRRQVDVERRLAVMPSGLALTSSAAAAAAASSSGTASPLSPKLGEQAPPPSATLRLQDRRRGRRRTSSQREQIARAAPPVPITHRDGAVRDRARRSAREAAGVGVGADQRAVALAHDAC